MESLIYQLFSSQDLQISSFLGYSNQSWVNLGQPNPWILLVLLGLSDRALAQNFHIFCRVSDSQLMTPSSQVLQLLCARVAWRMAKSMRQEGGNMWSCGAVLGNNGTAFIVNMKNIPISDISDQENMIKIWSRYDRYQYSYILNIWVHQGSI